MRVCQFHHKPTWKLVLSLQESLAWFSEVTTSVSSIVWVNFCVPQMVVISQINEIANASPALFRLDNLNWSSPVESNDYLKLFRQAHWPRLLEKDLYFGGSGRIRTYKFSLWRQIYSLLVSPFTHTTIWNLALTVGIEPTHGDLEFPSPYPWNIRKYLNWLPRQESNLHPMINSQP